MEKIMTTLTAEMTTKEKIELSQERIKASQLKDELKYESTYENNFHDALYIALHMEMGKEYTFLNSDHWYQPYTITKIKKRIFIAKIQEGYIALNLKQAINYIKGGRPVIEGEMFSTVRKQDINMMLFNYNRYRGKYKGLEINDCGVVTNGSNTVRRYFGKRQYMDTHFEYQWVKYPLNNRYYIAITCNNGGWAVGFNHYDKNFKKEKEAINYCLEYLLSCYSKEEKKYSHVIKYLKDLQNYRAMGIEIRYIKENKWDEPMKDFEFVGKGKMLSAVKVDENEDLAEESEEEIDETGEETNFELEEEEDEEETPMTDNTTEQLSLF